MSPTLQGLESISHSDGSTSRSPTEPHALKKRNFVPSKYPATLVPSAPSRITNIPNTQSPAIGKNHQGLSRPFTRSPLSLVILPPGASLGPAVQPLSGATRARRSTKQRPRYPPRSGDCPGLFKLLLANQPVLIVTALFWAVYKSSGILLTIASTIHAHTILLSTLPSAGIGGIAGRFNLPSPDLISSRSWASAC